MNSRSLDEAHEGYLNNKSMRGSIFVILICTTL